MLISLASDYFLFPSKIFPFLFFLFSPSPLTLGFSDIWYSAIFLYLCLSVCLSVCLTHTQSLVYISSLTPSPGLKLLRAIFLPSYITCNRQRALDYLRWWRFILKTLQRKRERPHREGGGAAAHGQASQRRERGLSRTPRGSPDAHVALLCPPTWAGAVLDSRCDSAALGRFLLHFWLLASLCRRLGFYLFLLLSAFLGVLTSGQSWASLCGYLPQDRKSDLALCLIIRNGASLLVRGPPDHLIVLPVLCLAFGRA